jgi:CubicO group peptidase (beta-lactamase class C family)
MARIKPRFLEKENALNKTSRILSVILSEIIALTCLWPGLTVIAQQVAAPLDKNEPELRAILTQIETDAENARVKAKIPGMSIVIVYGDDVLLAKGFGYADLEKKIPADTQTVYRIGSVTKVFTAMMLMQLRDAGKLHVDDAIEKYLPEFKIKSRFPDARPATFKQVASHYSGLPREPPMLHEYQATDEFPSVEDQLKSLKDTEMMVPANTMYSYSNLGYNIMGLALSRVAKQPYDQYVATHILKPLGMNHSGFALTEQMKQHFAVGYKSAGPDGTFQRSSYPKYGLASGMLYSNVDDLAEFLSLFFRTGPRGGKQVLGSYSLLEMLTPVVVSTDLSRDEKGRPTSLWLEGSTIGFSVGPFSGEQIDYKDGGTAGFSSIVYINYPRKLGMAVLTNTQTEPFWLGYNLLRKLTPVLAKSVERSQANALEEALPKWQKYVGRYVITDPNAIPTITFSEFDVSIVNKKLVITIPEVRPGSIVWMKEIPLEPFGNNDFKIAGGSVGNKFITFESGNDGNMILKWRNYIFKRQP